MLAILRKHLEQRLGNDTEGLDFVLSRFVEMKVKRNTTLLRAGEICRNVFFVSQGCLQVYVLEDGEEHTRDIVTEDNWCTDIVSFGKQVSAIENIRTVEACSLCTLSATAFRELTEKVPQFDKIYKQILEASYANSVYRINTFVALSSLDRIKWLMDYRPGLMPRLSSRLIASYLGINKDVFSRLKSRL